MGKPCHMGLTIKRVPIKRVPKTGTEVPDRDGAREGTGLLRPLVSGVRFGASISGTGIAGGNIRSPKIPRLGVRAVCGDMLALGSIAVGRCAAGGASRGAGLGRVAVHRRTQDGSCAAGRFGELVAHLRCLFLDDFSGRRDFVLDGLAVPDARGTGFELVVRCPAGPRSEDVACGNSGAEEKFGFHDELLLFRGICTMWKLSRQGRQL